MLLTPARLAVLIATLALVLGALIAPGLLLQVFFRGGFLLAGVAITLALRPPENDESHEQVALPVAHAIH